MQGCLVLIESNTTGTGRLFAKAAIKAGLTPILISANPARYPYVAEDGLQAIQADTTDRAAVAEACHSLSQTCKIAGITSSSDSFIALASALASGFGLPGPDTSAIKRCQDKARQRQVFVENQVPSPRFFAVASALEAVQAAREIGGPVVIKPVSGTGSVGVQWCQDPEEVYEKARHNWEHDVNEPGAITPRVILVEEYLAGVEYSVETFDRTVIGITRKHPRPLPYFVAIGHDFPAPVPADVASSLTKTTLQAVDALGLGWGPIHTELTLTAAGPAIIEVNPRLAGALVPELVRESLGIDLVEATVHRACGRAVDIVPKWSAAASIRFLLPDRNGTLVSVEGLDAAKDTPGVAEAKLYCSVGAAIALQGNFRDKIGHVLATGPDAAASYCRALTAANLIRMEIR